MIVVLVFIVTISKSECQVRLVHSLVRCLNVCLESRRHVHYLTQVCFRE
jgi:hypothetical protein